MPRAQDFWERAFKFKFKFGICLGCAPGVCIKTCIFHRLFAAVILRTHSCLILCGAASRLKGFGPLRRGTRAPARAHCCPSCDQTRPPTTSWAPECAPASGSKPHTHTHIHARVTTRSFHSSDIVTAHQQCKQCEKGFEPTGNLVHWDRSAQRLTSASTNARSMRACLPAMVVSKHGRPSTVHNVKV